MNLASYKEKVIIYDIILSESGFVVILQPEKYYDDRAILIIIGFAEAQLLTVQFNKVTTARPLIIDVIHNLFDLLEIRVVEVYIHDAIDNIFHAQIFLENNAGEKFLLDAKTSDALIFAINFNAPIYVEKNLLEKKSVIFNFNEEEDDEFELANTKEKQLKILQKELEMAIKKEHYEQAALMRDKIKKLMGEASD